MLWGLVALVAPSISSADERPSLARPVVALEFDAAPSEDVQALEQLSGLTVGQPFRPLAVRKAVRRLFQLGRFENVIVRAAPTAGGLRLTVSLPPRQRIQVFEIESDLFDDSEVLATIEAAVGDPFDPAKVPRWQAALDKALVQRGYRDPAIGIGHRALDAEGGVQVQIRIDEGPVTRLNEVTVQGRTRKPLWKVSQVLDLEPGEVLDRARVDLSVADLEAHYRRAGYLDVQIEVLRIDELPVGPSGRHRADIVLRIDAGPETVIRFKGNTAVATRALVEDAELLDRLGTGPAALGEVRERIVNRYERRGYWRVEVAPAIRKTRDGEKKEILFSIREGERAVVRNLTFPGNRLFDTGELEDVVVQTVRDALGDEDGQPGADPAVVDAIIGRVAGPGSTPQPDTSAPDPRQVYIPRAYRAAQEELADLYRARGYQTVEIGDPVIAPIERQSSVDVAIPVRQGVRWQVAVVSFDGNERFAADALLEVAALTLDEEDGQPLAFDDVERARRAVLKHYQDHGYLYAAVNEELRAIRSRDGATSKTSTASADVRQVCARAEVEGRPTCEIELLFRISEGPRVVTQDILVKGVERTWKSIIENEIVLRPDDVLRARDMEQTRDNLLRLGLFDLVDVRPLDENEVSQRKDVVVEIKERDNYWLELGVGASTEDGLRGFAAFGDGNLFGSALRLQLQARLNVWLPALLVLYNDEIRPQIDEFYSSFGTLGRLEYEVATGLSYPRIPGLPRGFSAGLDAIVLRDFDPAFLENTQTLTLLATYKSGRVQAPRPPSFQLRANVERTELDCNDNLARVLPPGSPVPPPDRDDPALLCSGDIADPNDPDASFRGTNAYFSAGPRVIWDLRDDSLDPKQGLYFEIESFYAFGLDADSPDYVNVNGRANVYVQLMPRLVFAMSALAAQLIQIGSSEEAIPLNRRLFAGGRTTVRGYAEKTLLPQDTELDPETGLPASTISTGGRLQAALKSELRILLFPALALSVFYDVGDLWQEGPIRFETVQTLNDGSTVRRTLAQGAGVGVRVSTPIGPLAIDLAVPVNRRDLGPTSPQLHFAVGSF